MIIEVEDTGSGIPEEHLEHVFEAFWQVEPSTTRRAGGAGLGLSVVKNLAARLGGDITVRSEVDRGTTFTVRLPIAATDPPAPLDGGEEGATGAATGRTESRRAPERNGVARPRRPSSRVRNGR
jgi:hypothetical protein